MSVRANFWEYFHTRVRTNRLDGQIVSGERIVWCANGTNQFFDEQIVWYLAVWKDDFSKTICPSRRTSRWPCCQTICPSRLFVRPGNAHFSSFDFTSNKLKLIFASHSDSSWSEKKFKLSTIFFRNFNPIREKTCLTGPLEFKYRVIFVLVLGVICTLRSAVQWKIPSHTV